MARLGRVDSPPRHALANAQLVRPKLPQNSIAVAQPPLVAHPNLGRSRPTVALRLPLAALDLTQREPVQLPGRGAGAFAASDAAQGDASRVGLVRRRPAGHRHLTAAQVAGCEAEVDGANVARLVGPRKRPHHGR